MQKTLYIKGEVKPEFSEINMYLRTEEMKFEVVPGKESVQKFLIKNNSMDNITITGIRVFPPEYEVSFSSNVIAPRSNLPVVLKLKPGIKKANTTDYIYLEIAIPFTTELKK